MTWEVGGGRFPFRALAEGGGAQARRFTVVRKNLGSPEQAVEPVENRELLWEPPPVLEAERAPRTDWAVFAAAATLTLAFVVWGAVSDESLASVAGSLLSGLMRYGGWVFVLTASVFVVFALWLALSRYGRIPLGREGEAPRYTTVSWIAMMFATGMGIGLMFYGVAEPLAHYVTPPPGTAGGDDAQRALTAMATTLFHWTLYPWAIYAVVGLAIAYTTFRRGRSQLISAAFIPLIGEKAANGPIGKTIDVIAVLATLFGSACSLGLGALQIGGGLQSLGWAEETTIGLLLLVIAVIMACYLVSAVSGIARGIKWLSNTNMVMAVVLLVFVLVTGPTVYILNLIPSSVAAYFQDFFQLAGRTEATGASGTGEWLSTWTVFYWAWWISWTPFVGLFIAKISRGRTIREFVTGVILVPSVVSLVWFSVFGGTAISLQASGVDLAGTGEIEEQFYGMLQYFPWSTAVSVLVALLVAIFFITGADSASIVMGTLTQRGADQPRVPMTVLWGLLIAAVAAIMLLVGEGGSTAIDGLQNITILGAAPWLVVMVMLCVALLKGLRRDPAAMRARRARELVHEAVVTGARTYEEGFRLSVAPAGSEVPPPRGSSTRSRGEAPHDAGAGGSGQRGDPPRT